MKLRVGLLLILASGAAIAGLQVTEKSLGWRVSPAREGDVVLKDIAACRAAINLRGPGEYLCEYSTAVKVVATCDDVPKPPLPKDTEAWAVQVTDIEWRTDVTAWVAVPPPACWALGRGELVYTDNEAEQGAPDLSPGPMVYCLDYGTPEKPPMGKACPASARAGCYIPPNAPDVCPLPAP
jgi:hypothetical protein